MDGQTDRQKTRRWDGQTDEQKDGGKKTGGGGLCTVCKVLYQLAE